MHVGTSADLEGARVSEIAAAAASTNNRVVSIRMRGLDPGTPYFYALEVGGILDLTKAGRFTTPASGPQTFTFAMGSCAETGSSHSGFDTIRTGNPLFFLHLGDLYYEDIDVDDPGLFRAAYNAVLAAPAQSRLYRDVPIVYMWDDHDFGPNNSDATAPGRTSARSTYQQYVPHYPLVAGSGRDPANAQVVGWSRCAAAAPPADTDGDAVADTDDCAFADSTAWARPTLVSGLRLDRSGETGMPAPDDGLYVLVRAVNVCGTGRYGQGVAADPRFPLEGDAPCALP